MCKKSKRILSRSDILYLPQIPLLHLFPSFGFRGGEDKDPDSDPPLPPSPPPTWSQIWFACGIGGGGNKRVYTLQH